MRKRIFGRKLKRDKNERKALFKSLLSALVLEEKIKTTESKAKAIKGQAEKLVTKALKKPTNIERFMQEFLVPLAIEKLVNQIAPVFVNRKGGYTRIVRLGNRLKDNAPQVLLEWVEKPIENSKVKVQNAKVKGKSSKETKETEETKGKKKASKVRTSRSKSSKTKSK